MIVMMTYGREDMNSKHTLTVGLEFLKFNIFYLC
jgi:hypothetical protein